MTNEPKPVDAATVSELSFEEAIGQLESIIERVEKGDIGIERALVEYEQGVTLVARCDAILKTVEQRLDELVSPGDDNDSGART